MKQSDVALDSLEFVEIDPDLAGIVPEYLETKKKEAETLLAQLSSGDFSSLQRFGHSLKGSGGGYGFSKLTQMGAEIEELSKAKRRDDLSKSIQNLKNYLARVRIK